MNNIDRIIKDTLNENINIPKDFDNTILHSLDNDKISNEHINLKRILQLVATMIIVFIGIGSYAYYSYEKINKEKYIPEQQVSEAIPYYHKENDMEYIDSLEDYINATPCELIVTYEKYLEVKKKYGNIIEMTEEDFEDYMIFIVLPNKYSEVSNIYTNDDTMYVELKQITEKSTTTERCIISKIDKNLYREKIVIRNIPELEGFSGYTPIFDLAEDYSKEDAIEDGCIVSEQISKGDRNPFHLISNNESKLEEFIKKTENGEEASLRVINYSKDIIYYIDIYFSNDIYNLCVYEENLIDEQLSRTAYYSGNMIIKRSNNDINLYALYDYKYNVHNWIINIIEFDCE